MLKKMISVLIILIVIGFIVAIPMYFLDFSQTDINWGVTFSPYYAQDELGLDWRETYLAILDDLKIDHLRLSAYWNRIEPQPDKYDFSDLDWQINEAAKRQVKIILAVGRKLPRWPECHDPSWLKSLTDKEAQQKQLSYLEAVIKRYNNNPNIIIWQIENEPFLKLFGQCPPFDKNFLYQEIALAKKLTQKPIMVTDSGELNWWVEAAKTKADIVGTTLYRMVYNKYVGYIPYVLPPAFYRGKGDLIAKLFKTQEVIIAELQAEAWHVEGKTLKDMAKEETDQSLSLRQFKKNLLFARRSGAKSIYLWGVEWWYYLKKDRQDDSFWQAAKTLWPQPLPTTNEE